MTHSDSSTVIECRAATRDDAAALAPLVYASGVHEFQFLLGVDEQACVAFLRWVISWPRGHFSWRRHRLVSAVGVPVAVLAIQDGRVQWSDNPLIAHAFIQRFGLKAALGIMARGLLLEREIPPPKRGETLLAHCATAPDWRSQGLFQRLFADALAQGLLPAQAQQRLQLDVLLSNPRAQALYQRCGFVVIERSRPEVARLPSELRSIRMQYQPQ